MDSVSRTQQDHEQAGGVVMIDYVALCRVPPGLVDHVTQLLTDASVASHPIPDGDAVVLAVSAADTERATSVLGLVLPDLLRDDPDTVRLSDRLVRSDPDDFDLPQLIDGTAVLSGLPSSAAPEEPLPLSHEEEYVPPPPPEIPKPKDRISRFAWGGVILGPLLLLLTVLLQLPDVLTTVGLAVFIAGFCTLVARHEEKPRDGWDDGAVV